MSVRRWTTDDEKQLRALVASRPRLSASEIGKRLGRSRNSVIGRCHRIGLALPLPPKEKGKGGVARRPNPIPRVENPPANVGLKCGRWSDDEVTRLRQLFAQRPRLSAVEIANKLNRKADSVRGALRERGLSLRGNRGDGECKPAVSEPVDRGETVLRRARVRQDIDRGKPGGFPAVTGHGGASLALSAAVPQERRGNPPGASAAPPCPEGRQSRPGTAGEPAVEAAKPTRFADLAAHQCRFPIGNDQPGPDMACCGRAVVDITVTTGLRATHCADCLKKMVAPAWQ